MKVAPAPFSPGGAPVNLPIKVKPTNNDYSGRNLFGNSSSDRVMSDDIDGSSWLDEINMGQYTETFLTNLSSDGQFIIRKRLQTVRIQDLPKMGITSFEDQKIIMGHIKLMLKYPFKSPIRIKEVKLNSPEAKQKKTPLLAKKAPVPNNGPAHKPAPTKSSASSSTQTTTEVLSLKKTPELIADDHPEVTTPRIDAPNSIESVDKSENGKEKDKTKEKDKSHPEIVTVKEQQLQKKKDARRRRSFDSSIWQSITSMRTKSHDASAAASMLREGIIPSSISTDSRDFDNNSEKKKTPSSSRRRWSFGTPEVSLENSLAKAQAYGNMALEYDITVTKLKTLQSEYLNEFKNMLKCERASIFFLNDISGELVLFADDGLWYRLPRGSGIAGHCVETGKSLNIKNAYEDIHFNKNMDIKTGQKTHNLLCHPIRRNRGGGEIIAIIEMINKHNNEDFTQEDEDMLSVLAQKIADVLCEKFQELQNCGALFSGSAVYISSNKNNGEVPSYAEETQGSKVRFAPSP